MGEWHEYGKMDGLWLNIFQLKRDAWIVEKLVDVMIVSKSPSWLSKYLTDCHS